MIRQALVLFTGLVGMSVAALGAEMPENWDGLVEVKPKRMEAVYLLPGADFRPYTAVMIDKTGVQFSKNWLRDMNDPFKTQAAPIGDDDAKKILLTAQSNFDDIFAEAFKKAGYTVVTGPAPEALRVSTVVMNLYINAPDRRSAEVARTYVTEAGEATLVMEVRDSMSGALMGRVLDRRETRQTGAKIATSASNLADFRALFQDWARISAKGLEELKAQSPVPTDLKPKQKL